MLTVNRAEDDKNNPPKPLLVNDGRVSGTPTTPGVARGLIDGTLIDATNKRIEHACDFILNMNKDIALKKFIKAVARWIRDGIRNILRFLGLTDPTGQYSTVIGKLKKIAEEIRYFKKEYIDPIIEFEKYVLAVLVKIRAIIQWILSLPARLLALLEKCISNLIKYLAQIFFDALSEAAAETPAGEVMDVIGAVKDVINATVEVVEATATVVALGAGIVASATAGLVVPVSATDLRNADATIADWNSKHPTIEEATPAAQKEPNPQETP
jgi:hypothetical protein